MAKALHAPDSGQPEYALELRGVTKQLGGNAILRGVDLQVRSNEILLLIGPNGAGKSTLFNVISGMLVPDQGEILLLDQAIHGLRPEQIYRQGLSRSFQISQLFQHQSVIENLQLASLWQSGCRYAFWQRLAKWQIAHERASAMSARLGLDDVAQHKVGSLSYAQQRLLELGMCLLADSPVILLDEPTAGLSRAETSKVLQLIREFAKNKTVLMIEHDMNVVFEMADRIAVLVYGEMVACDSPQQIRNNPAVQQAYLGSQTSLPVAGQL